MQAVWCNLALLLGLQLDSTCLHWLSLLSVCKGTETAKRYDWQAENAELHRKQHVTLSTILGKNLRTCRSREARYQ